MELKGRKFTRGNMRTIRANTKRKKIEEHILKRMIVKAKSHCKASEHLKAEHLRACSLPKETISADWVDQMLLYSVLLCLISEEIYWSHCKYLSLSISYLNVLSVTAGLHKPPLFILEIKLESYRRWDLRYHTRVITCITFRGVKIHRSQSKIDI